MSEYKRFNQNVYSKSNEHKRQNDVSNMTFQMTMMVARKKYFMLIVRC
jgi:hypothetical protein